MKGYGRLASDQLNRGLELTVSTYANEITLVIVDDQSEARLITVTMRPDDCLELIQALRLARQGESR